MDVCVSPCLASEKSDPCTMFVPYTTLDAELDACSLWKVPVLPVKPWQITLVCLKTAGDVDEAWTAFRKQLELGREIEVVDENGDRIEYGDYPDEEDPEYD